MHKRDRSKSRRRPPISYVFPREKKRVSRKRRPLPVTKQNTCQILSLAPFQARYLKSHFPFLLFQLAFILLSLSMRKCASPAIFLRLPCNTLALWYAACITGDAMLLLENVDDAIPRQRFCRSGLSICTCVAACLSARSVRHELIS